MMMASYWSGMKSSLKFNSELRSEPNAASFSVGKSIGFDEVFFNAGQEEGEDCAVMDGVLGAAKREPAAVAIYDAGGDPEAEAGTVEVLGGVEGFKETAADGR